MNHHAQKLLGLTPQSWTSSFLAVWFHLPGLSLADYGDRNLQAVLVMIFVEHKHYTDLLMKPTFFREDFLFQEESPDLHHFYQLLPGQMEDVIQDALVLPRSLLLVRRAQNTTPRRCPGGILAWCPNHVKSGLLWAPTGCLNSSPHLWGTDITDTNSSNGGRSYFTSVPSCLFSISEGAQPNDQHIHQSASWVNILSAGYTSNSTWSLQEKNSTFGWCWRPQ